MILAIIIAALSLFISPSIILATDIPIQISPVNNSTIKQLKPKLIWQYSGNCPTDTKISCFRVELDTSPLFSNPKYNYTNAFSYSPQTLTDGIWYWRVKAKNSDEIWSDWSSTWLFTLQINSSSPSPTSSPTSTPTPTTTPNSNTFIISNAPTQINSDQSFTTSVNLSLSDKPNTNFYIKGAFKHPDKPNNYFGLTKVGGEWIKNSSSSTNQYPIKTDQSGNWSGLLEVKIDPDDSGYLGSGDYIFKVARYDPLIWSNEVTIHINNVENTQNSSTDNQTSSSETIVNSSPTASSVLSKSSISESKNSTRIASVAGVSKSATTSSSSTSSPSANVKVAPQKQINPFIIIGSLFVIIGVSSLGFIIYKKHETI